MNALGHSDPVEDVFDQLVAEAFPNEPLAKWGAGIKLHNDGTITVSYQGREVKIHAPSKRDYLP